MNRLVVDGKSERWLRRGFPWVYPAEVVRGGGPPGARCAIESRRGEPLGQGLLDAGWIAARVYRHDDGPIDRDWVHATLDRAATLREQVVGSDTTGFRLVHGENDGLPGVRVDWWAGHAVVVLDTPAAGPLLVDVTAWLEARRQPESVSLCYRPDPRDDRPVGDRAPAPGPLVGQVPSDPVPVRERGLVYEVLPGDGPDVGLYADMREVRAWLEPHWRGASVLNTFAFTGAFSVSAAAHGASEVVTGDLSRAALDRAVRNFEANGLDPGAHEFVAEDTFRTLDRFRRAGRRFDRVVLDPPAFSRSREGAWSARRDMPRLVAAASRVLGPDGWLIAASNQGDISPRQFGGFVEEGLRKARRAGQRILAGSQAPDFPAATWFPEGSYLKVGVWRLP